MDALSLRGCFYVQFDQIELLTIPIARRRRLLGPAFQAEPEISTFV